MSCTYRFYFLLLTFSQLSSITSTFYLFHFSLIVNVCVMNKSMSFDRHHHHRYIIERFCFITFHFVRGDGLQVKCVHITGVWLCVSCVYVHAYLILIIFIVCIDWINASKYNRGANTTETDTQHTHTHASMKRQLYEAKKIRFHLFILPVVAAAVVSSRQTLHSVDWLDTWVCDFSSG